MVFLVAAATWLLLLHAFATAVGEGGGGAALPARVLEFGDQDAPAVVHVLVISDTNTTLSSEAMVRAAIECALERVRDARVLDERQVRLVLRFVETDCNLKYKHYVI